MCLLGDAHNSKECLMVTLGDSNAVSQVFLRQKLAHVVQVEVLPIWDKLANSGKKSAAFTGKVFLFSASLLGEN